MLLAGTPDGNTNGFSKRSSGRIEDDKFLELMTKTMYYNPSCMLWDMQKTLLSYAEAHDKLTGSSLLKEFMDGFDENNDGIIDYDENGRKGFWTPGFRILNHSYDIMLTEKYGQLRGVFLFYCRFRPQAFPQRLEFSGA
ncbi:hypothetical protein [Methanosarcina horonobensis]|uniref:hypothetical protein n=1 Tax=Methanosarcina horonobensis TaxID=418008 RepID=UPI000A75FD93|nr:hypothetical protein [Methanosarcina horonobensis]